VAATSPRERQGDHPTGPAEADDAAASATAQRVTLVGAVVDAGLGVAKIVVGALAQSQALIADGVHSLSDLATDAGVLVVARLARRAPDTEHPYGHERFETLGALTLGAILLVVAGALGQESLGRLLRGGVSVPGMAALIVAAASIAAKEGIYHYTRRAARRIGSSLLLANAWHSRSDALSSVAVLLGVSGAMAGFPWLDLVAALAVSALVGWVGFRLIAGAAIELVDTGLSAERLAELRLEALNVPGVLGIHQVRSRRMGESVLLDLDIVVGPGVSVSEGHHIGWTVQHRLRRRFPWLRDVKVHVDPQIEATRGDLPLRAQVESLLLERWRDALPAHLERLTLHYERNGIDVEAFIAPESPVDAPAGNAGALARRLEHLGADLDWLGGVRVWWTPPAEPGDAATPPATKR